MAGRIVAITVTGGRHKAFDLCKLWMSRQTVKPDLWIVVDDCLPASIAPDIDGVQTWVIYPNKVWKPGDNSQAANLLLALQGVRWDDKVLIIEDDDYYAPCYIEKMVGWLDNHDLVGESNALYYNVAHSVYKNCMNYGHASLCSTGVTRDAIGSLVLACRNRSKFIDLALWRTFVGRKRLYATRYSVGIKGLPGRPGIGSGHRMRGSNDRGGIVLKRFLGSDASYYKDP